MMKRDTILKGGAILIGLAIAGAGITVSAYGMGNGMGANTLTDAQKTILEQARELREAGNTDEARTLLEENGLNAGMRGGMRGRANLENMTDEEKAAFEARREEMQAAREAERTAIETNDYQAFLVARPDNAPEVTAETFAKIVEAHALREAGDDEGARAIMEAIGFPMNMGRGIGGHGGCGGEGFGQGRPAQDVSSTESE